MSSGVPVLLVHVGFGGMIAANRIIAILTPDSSPTRRMIREARDQGRIIDMTNGRKTKAVIVTDSDHIALAALNPDTIANRVRDLLRPEVSSHDS